MFHVLLLAAIVAFPTQTQVSAPDAEVLPLPSVVGVSFTPVDAPALSQQTPPAQPHTGFRALLRETGSDFVAFPRRKSTWVILAAGAAGAAAVHPVDPDLNARLIGNRAVTRLFRPGKIVGLGLVQMGAAVTTYVVGRYVLPHKDESRTNKVAHLGFDLVRAQIVTQTLTHAMKQVGQRKRPDGSCCAFPSGHSSTTFATAAVLERHLGLRGAWPTILIASYVAASRLHDNRHFASDVVFGAALGTAVGWTVVGRHGRSNYALLPVRVPGGIGVNIVRLNRAGNVTYAK